MTSTGSKARKAARELDHLLHANDPAAQQRDREDMQWYLSHAGQDPHALDPVRYERFAAVQTLKAAAQGEAELAVELGRRAQDFTKIPQLPVITPRPFSRVAKFG